MPVGVMPIFSRAEPVNSVMLSFGSLEAMRRWDEGEHTSAATAVATYGLSHVVLLHCILEFLLRWTVEYTDGLIESEYNVFLF